MERIVTQVQFSNIPAPKCKRVAAYARVSNGKDAMLHSLFAQVSYYSDLIQNHSGWQYVGVYADEALTGTKDNRQNFQRLLADCRAGLVDMVITKSISRFSGNGSLTARSAFPTASSLVTAKGRTACRKLWKMKPKSSAPFTGCAWRENPQMP